ncbi:hypothetical protein FACS189496_0790 [Bacilli bacterium]|nr:hypothetical protein FACS189496_0790 [Bacilli bacterium]
MTVQDYMHDPRLLSDPDMEGALEPIKELHAARLKIQDETSGMAANEEAAYHKNNLDALFSSKGRPLPQFVNFSGQGKLRVRGMVGK